VFQDQDQVPLPSPPFDFRELPSPPAGEQGRKDIISKTHLTNMEKCKSNKVILIQKKKCANELMETNSLSNEDQKENNGLLKSGKDSILPNKESVGKSEYEKVDICEKCHHRKGKLRSKSFKKKDEKIKQAKDSKSSQMQQLEEKETLKRYILVGVSKDNICNCLDHVDKTFKKKAKHASNEPSNFDF